MATRATAALALAAGLAGCSLAGRTPETRYYVLSVPAGAAARLDAPVRVDGFTVDDPYTTRQLAYRTSPYRLAYYSYHRWAGDPPNVVANAVRDYFEQATTTATGAPIEIRGHIRRLEEVDAPDVWSAAIALDVIARRDGQVILERSYREDEPAATQNPEAVVAAMSRALGRILDEVVAALAADEGTTPPPAPRRRE